VFNVAVKVDSSEGTLGILRKITRKNERSFMMKKRDVLLRFVLLSNGSVDIVCTIVLLLLPLLHRPLLGYQIFDGQGALMAGGWGIATLALGVTRIWASNRARYHEPMNLMGLVEGSTLAVFTFIYVLTGTVTLVQALLPLAIGVVYGVLYAICAVTRPE
jgi:hypothetical protein